MTPANNAVFRKLRIPWGRGAPIVILVACNLILGFLLTPHYGQSTDESPNVIFARETLLSYQHPESPYVDVMREDKGPFYLMVWLRVGEFLDRAVRGWAFVDGRHFANFLTFQMAIVSVYVLALRFVRPAAALAGTLLFETQPVFFGHAFINQKDTPFMAFFALTVVLGLGMVDHFVGTGGRRRSETGSADADPSSIAPALRSAWAEDPRRGRGAAVLMAVLALVVPVLTLAFRRPLGNAIEGVVTAAYRGEAWAPINRLFIRLAQHAAQVPVEDYISRATLFTNLAIFAASVLMVCLALAVAGRVWPKGARAGRSDLAANLHQGVLSPFPLIIVPAAIVFGMSIAIRTTALYAGLLVAGYALVRAGPRIAILLLVYFGAAAVVAYAFWPQLWLSPLGLIFSSLDRTLQFPLLRPVLLDGVIYQSNQLPFWYLPEVMVVQFTLPATALVLVGLVLLVGLARRRDPLAVTAWVLLLWFLAPFVAVVAFRTPIYNYFRHVLFMMPPLFVMAAIAVERLLRLVRAPLVGALLVVALLLPGVFATIRLHPYEYGYFNELVGGVRGAYGRYMSDYWCTSLREAMGFVNGYAPPSAQVAVAGPRGAAADFAREDIQIRNDEEMATSAQFRPMLIVGCSWATIDPAFFPNAPVLWIVQRDGVPLAIVKLLATPQPTAP